jgi:hypothetical protein
MIRVSGRRGREGEREWEREEEKIKEKRET